MSEVRREHPDSKPTLPQAHFPPAYELELNGNALIEVSVYVKREDLTEAEKAKLPPRAAVRRAALHLLRHKKYAAKIEKVHDFATATGLSVTHTDPARRLEAIRHHRSYGHGLRTAGKKA